jgi:hypothetical protein
MSAQNALHQKHGPKLLITSACATTFRSDNLSSTELKCTRNQTNSLSRRMIAMSTKPTNEENRARWSAYQKDSLLILLQPKLLTSSVVIKAIHCTAAKVVQKEKNLEQRFLVLMHCIFCRKWENPMFATSVTSFAKTRAAIVSKATTQNDSTRLKPGNTRIIPKHQRRHDKLKSPHSSPPRADFTCVTPFRSIRNRFTVQFPLEMACSRPFVMVSGFIHLTTSKSVDRLAFESALSVSFRRSLFMRLKRSWIDEKCTLLEAGSGAYIVV